MQTLKYDDIVDVIYGATLMGGGGGGSMKNGLDMLHKYMDTQGLKPEDISLDMYTPDEMQDGAYAAVTAGMGAPTAIKDVDFSVYATNTFNLLKEMAAKLIDPPCELGYSMAVELGGFNTFVPMLISLVQKIPFLDVEGAARAVPALTTLLFNVNGYDTSPLAMADGFEGTTDCDKVTIQLRDPRNAALAEKLGRDILVEFGQQMSGLSGWMLRKDEFDPKKLPYGSVDLSRRIGHVLRNTSADDVFKMLGQFMTCRTYNTYEVIGGESGSGTGFDDGWIEFKNANNAYLKIVFQNENLVLSYKIGAGEYKPLMTAPDIICSFKIEGNEPLTNADYFVDDKIIMGLKVKLGLIKVSETWWNTGYDNVNAIWKEYFANVKYDGDIIQYEKVNAEGLD